MRLIKLFAIFLLVVSCKKEEPVTPSESFKLNNGILVLCEGLFQQNNASVSWIDLGQGSIDNQFFVSRTNLSLGDTGNDMQQYGGKIYIVVNVSSTIEVVSADSFTPIKQIQMFDGATAKQPRHIEFSGSNAYVTCYDGYVDVIDTASLTVTNRIAVGANPEGMTVANNKLYVANSGGLNFPNMDSTLSVIDLSLQTEIQKITVGKNPGSVISDATGDVYVIARGDYGAIPSRLIRVSSVSDTKEEEFPFEVSSIASMNNNFLISANNTISLFDPNTEQMISSNFVNLSDVVTMYNVVYHSATDKIYIMDAMNYTNTGYLRKYSSAGAYISSYHVGLNPSKVLFYD